MFKIFLLIVIGSVVRQITSTCMFVQSFISEDSLVDFLVTQKNYPGFSAISATCACCQIAWCHSVCLQGSKFVLSSLDISGGIDIAATGNRIPCFTDRRRVIYPDPSAVLTGSPLNDNRPLENLKDGVYNGRDINHCFQSTSTTVHPYFLVEFATQMPVYGVSVRAQPKGILAQFFGNFEVRVGNTSDPASKFADNELLGTYPTAPTEYNVDLTIQKQSPIYGKFVSFQDFASSRLLQVCMVEIY